MRASGQPPYLELQAVHGRVVVRVAGQVPQRAAGAVEHLEQPSLVLLQLLDLLRAAQRTQGASTTYARSKQNAEGSLLLLVLLQLLRERKQVRESKQSAEGC